jgi:hypothetical protein
MRLWPNFKVLPIFFFLQGKRKTMESLSQDNQCPTEIRTEYVRSFVACAIFLD